MIKKNQPNYLILEHGDQIQTMMTNEGNQVRLEFVFGTMSVGQMLTAIDVAAMIVWLQQWELQQERPVQP